MLREAVGAQPDSFEPAAVIAWFGRHVPSVDPLLIEGLLTGATVNDRGRQHIPEAQDLMFRRRDGLLERYDPRRHGRWTKLGRPGPDGPPYRLGLPWDRRSGDLRYRRAG